MSNRVQRIQQVVLASSAAATIRQEARRSTDGYETGGLLLGQVDATATAWIGTAGGPGPAAVHRPAFFLRDLAHAQRLAAEAFARDGSEWIGEWHTHPRGEPIPSARDLHTYLGFLDDPQLQFDAFLALVVVAPTGAWEQLELCAWVCYHHHAQQVSLTVTPDTDPASDRSTP